MVEELHTAVAARAVKAMLAHVSIAEPAGILRGRFGKGLVGKAAVLVLQLDRVGGVDRGYPEP